MRVRGYHGTTLEIANRLLGGEEFIKSAGGGHWLGSGIYFFQEAPGRAKHWASTKCRAATDVPAVLSADIDLTDCLDLLDMWGWKKLERHYGRFALAGFDAEQEPLEIFGGRTKPPPPGITLARNRRDRALVDWSVEAMETRTGPVTSVRSAFLWGRAIFPESYLFNWSHVEIAVRDRASIINLALVT